jgi:hypothetical protein
VERNDSGEIVRFQSQLVGSVRGDILRYQGGSMSDVLIRDIPDDVLAGLDAHAARLGLSRSEYIRRRLAQDASASAVPVTVADLHRLADEFADLTDPAVMGKAWE